jgi:hypothetical protein
MTKRRAGRPRWPVAAAIMAPPVLVAVVVVGFGLPADPSPSAPGDMWVGGSGPGPASTAVPGDVDAAHQALHSLGDQCRSAAPDSGAILASVDAIAGFALRYPVGRFPIDDESATADSLLRVTRETLTGCAPDQLVRVDQALQAIDAGVSPAP